MDENHPYFTGRKADGTYNVMILMTVQVEDEIAFRSQNLIDPEFADPGVSVDMGTEFGIVRNLLVATEAEGFLAGTGLTKAGMTRVLAGETTIGG